MIGETGEGRPQRPGEIGIGGDLDPLEEGLRRLGAALDDMMEN